ncbi:MAG: SAM-dependent methyltransferase, partial [Myxococcota bacterium]|nr:SAM-dependent methyltransferase [Myxococcota bacterium]
LAQALPDARLLAIEAQKVSHALLERNVREAGLADRVETSLGDIRTTEVMGDRRFDLVTGTPPFMPVGSGTMPADAQRAAARFELRGGVEAYCEVAARHLAPEGVLSLVMDAERPERYEAAIHDAGLHLQRVITVLARTGGPARYLVYWAGARADQAVRRELAVRTDDGDWTSAFASVRHFLGLLGT